MSSAARGLCAFALLAWLTNLPVGAQQAGGSASGTATTVPTDPNKDYRVAVTVFRGEGLSSDNDYLKQSIPMLLVQKISALSKHHFDDSELAAYQREIVDGAISDQQQTINKLLEDRATILFQSSDPATQLAASTKSIDAARARLKFLESLDPGKIAVIPDKPIELVQGSGKEPLVPYPILSSAHTVREMKLDLLVTGSVTQVEDYFVVHIVLFNRALDGDVYSFRKVFTASNVMDSASEVSDQLARAILGRAFGTLDLSVRPASALVYLDGDFYGVGSATIPYVSTGKHELELRAPGYQAEKMSVTITPFSETKKTVELAALSRPEVVVSSVPAGADVYLASLWRGKTPLVLQRPEADEALVLRREGYYDYTTTLSSSSPVKTTVRLVPKGVDTSQRLRDLRNRFYTSFGAFALSMILPVTFYSLLQQDYVNSQLTTSVAEYQQLSNQYSAWYYAYLGGAFVSSALFTNTVIDIFDYLRAIR